MKRSEAQTRIVTRLISSGLFPTERIALPNKPFDIPSGGEWCRVTFSGGSSDQTSIGSIARFERDGIFTIQVFVGQATGSNTGLDLAESIGDLYEKQTGDKPVYYESPNVAVVGIDPAGWFQHNVTVNYEFSVCK